MKLLALAALVSCLVVPVRAADKAERADRFKVLHVADLSAALESAQPPKVFDANTKDVRKKQGVIPGAVLLSSYKKYDVAKVLPADKTRPVVFYCANEMCMASHQAAEKAIDAGYKDVGVMVDGIFGWKKAGKPTQTLAAAAKASKPADKR